MWILCVFYPQSHNHTVVGPSPIDVCWRGHSTVTIYTILPKVLGTCLYTYMNFNCIPVLVHRVQYWVGPPFEAITASTLLGRLSTRFRSVSMGMFDHSSRSAFVRSGTDVGREGLAQSPCPNSCQRCSIELRSSFSTPNSLIHWSWVEGSIPAKGGPTQYWTLWTKIGMPLKFMCV